MVKSIFDATREECPKELEQQADDMVELNVITQSYMRKYHLTLNDIMHDLRSLADE